MAVSKRDKDAHAQGNRMVKKKDYNLDPSLWRLVEVDGLPIAALYFNGREFSRGYGGSHQNDYSVY